MAEEYLPAAGGAIKKPTNPVTLGGNETYNPVTGIYTGTVGGEEPGAGPTAQSGPKMGGPGGYTPGTWSGELSWQTPYLTPFNAPRFATPTLQQAQEDPGYQFRLQSGRDALEKSAAARGVLRTGGTLKDIQTYGQNFASQEYANVYNRALQAFDRNYKAAFDEYQPVMAKWREDAQASRIQAQDTFNTAYNAWALGEHNKAAAAQQQNSILSGLS